MNVTYKILSYCTLDRIKPFTENIIGYYQSGFKGNKSSIDQNFIIRQLFKKTWEFDQELYTFFVDFKKAYNSFNRESIYTILVHFRVPQKLIGLIRTSLNKIMANVKIDNILLRVIIVNIDL